MNAHRILAAALATATLVASGGAGPAAAEPHPVDALAPGYPVGNHSAAGNQMSDCTAGFVTYNPKRTPILLMAGHCDEGGVESIYYRATGDWEAVGSFLVNMYEPPYSDSRPDIGAVPLSESRVPVSTSLLRRTPVTGAALPTVGQRLCKVGSYSGTTCGKVTKVTSNKVHFEAFNRYGDSGGPVFFENGDGTVTAVGLDSALSSGSDSCRIDSTGSQDCGGTTIAELIVPWMQKWGLTFS